MSLNSLDSEQKSELPLILFTLCTPTAVGVALFALFDGSSLVYAATSLVLVSVGMVASIAHLAKPLRAPTSLRNVSTSWLSREIMVVGVFWGLVLLWAATCVGNMQGLLLWPFLPFTLNVGVVAGGSCLLVVIARAYHVHAQPAWHGFESVPELGSVALCVGSAGGLVLYVLGALLLDRPVSLMPLIVSVLLAAAGAVLGNRARRARFQRLQQVCATEPSPRVEAASHLVGSMSRRWRLVDVLTTVGCMLMLGIGILAGVSEGGGFRLGLAVCAGGAFVAIALQGVAQFLARDSFYRLAVHGRYAVRLHRW